MPLSPALIREGLVAGAGELVVIAGPCLVEDEALMVGLATQLAATCARHRAQFIFKASFDKANRSSSRSPRGPGIDRGLAALGAVGDELGVALTTDIHEAWQADRAAEIVDLIQIPAFLCRQTDLLTAAAATGKAVNVKKAQFLSPGDMRNVVDKLRVAGGTEILLTERGTTFGYGNLVVDFRSLPLLRDLGHPVVFDASHSVQLPGGRGDASGGQSEFVPPLARAAAAVGIDALFMEVHPSPAGAPSDGFNMITPAVFDVVLREVQAIRLALGTDVTMVADA